MNVKVILNPYANRWKAKGRVAEVRQALEAASLRYDVAITTEPGEGITLAEEAAGQGYDAIVAAGGDGTINEVINGLLRAAPEGPTVPFGILPLGSANDFCLMAGLPRTIPEAAQVIAAGQTWLIDAGRVNHRYFLNNSAVGMEPMVTLEHIRIQRLKGEIRYYAALLKALVKLRAWEMEIEWDDGRYSGPTFLLSVCNGPRTGGFPMAPGAQIDDGLFDIVFAPQVPKLTFVWLLVLLMRGQHVQHQDVTFTRVSRVRLTSRPGTPVHADGELFAEAAATVDYAMLPGKVPLLSSRGS